MEEKLNSRVAGRRNRLRQLNGNLGKIGYSQYEISESGEVTNLRTGQVLRPFIDKRGYENFSLWGDNGERKTFRGHQLVARVFIPNPNNYPQVDHIDCDKRNNHVTNLEWVSNETNIQRANANGLHGSSYKVEDVIEICRLLESGESIKDIAHYYGFPESLIYNIKYKVAWTHISAQFNI